MLAALLPLLFLMGCADEASKDAGLPPLDSTRVEVEDVVYQKLPSGARIVAGALHNRSDRHIRNAQIQLALYNADNVRVGEINVPVKDVSARQSKRFRASVDDDAADVRSVRPRSVLVQ